MADWPSSDDHWADIPTWGSGWEGAPKVEPSTSSNGWPRLVNVEGPPRKRNIGNSILSNGFYSPGGQEVPPYPTPFSPQSHSAYDVNSPKSPHLSYGYASYGQSQKQYDDMPYRTTEAPYKTTPPPPHHTPFNIAPISYSKPPSPYSFPHQPFQPHFQPTPTPYNAPAVPPPYSRPPYNPKANQRPAPGNSLQPLRVTPPDFSQFQRKQPKEEANSGDRERSEKRSPVFEGSLGGGRSRERPGRGLAPPRRPGSGFGQGPPAAAGRQQRLSKPNFPPRRPRPPLFTNRAVIPFRHQRRTQPQKRKTNPNAIVGDPFAPVDPSFDFADDFNEFEKENGAIEGMEEDFFQESDDNPFGQPGFPGPEHEEGGGNGGGPVEKEEDFGGPMLTEGASDGFEGGLFEDRDIVSQKFESGKFGGTRFGEVAAENKRRREHFKLERHEREQKADTGVEVDREPLDFRYSTIGLELYKASRGVGPRRPAHREPNRPRHPESLPKNLPHSGFLLKCLLLIMDVHSNLFLAGRTIGCKIAKGTERAQIFHQSN